MPRVVIAGAGGGVGASAVFNLLLSALECEVVMVDARQNMVHSHLWDLEQVLEQIPPSPTGSVRAGLGAGRRRRRRPGGDGRGAADRQHLADGLPARQRRDPGATARRAARGMAGHPHRRHQSGGPALHLGPAPHRPGAHPAARLHPQRLTAAAHRHRARAGRRPRAGGGLDRRRARRPGGAAVGPRDGQRRARGARRHASERGHGVRGRLVCAPRRAGLGALLDLDVGAGHRAHGPRLPGRRRR